VAERHIMNQQMAFINVQCQYKITSWIITIKGRLY